MPRAIRAIVEKYAVSVSRLMETVYNIEEDGDDDLSEWMQEGSSDTGVNTVYLNDAFAVLARNPREAEKIIRDYLEDRMDYDPEDARREAQEFSDSARMEYMEDL